MRSELFEETLKQHKDGLIDELEQLGKHRQAQLVAWDIEQNESDYEFYFNAAWQHQQSKVDELTKQRDSFIKAYEIEMDKSIELQKRVDAALKILSSKKKMYVDMVIEIEQALKGGEDANQ